jgi:hypothetical protein
MIQFLISDFRLNQVHFRNIERQLKENKGLLEQWRQWATGGAPDKGSVNDLSIIGIASRAEPFRNRIYQRVFGKLIWSSSVATAPDAEGIWFDEWEIRPGDSIPAKIEEGLERSRVLLLCMSASAFGVDWANLESATFRFRDPFNKERRFIPLRLDNTPPKGRSLSSLI